MLTKMWATGTHSLLVGMLNGTVTSEDSLAVSYKLNSLTIRSSNNTPRY